MIESAAFRLPVPSVVATAMMMLVACSRHDSKPTRAAYLPLAQLEGVYGRLITAGNHPTPCQNGTGDRIGLFPDPNGIMWGLPLAAEKGAEVFGCTPSELHRAKVTDKYPVGAPVLGATNDPTGWRGRTGKLEILLRRSDGEVRWRAVSGGETSEGSVCWAQELPGPSQRLHYYRLALATEEQ